MILFHECTPVFFAPRPAEELFDVKNDPEQLLNVASMPEYQEKLKKTRQQI
ncbi:MAG TPA: hypothetical protein VMV77_20035 [Bacteroidales bacterium]|nr:hypothetical protein [Bacteroidales bacterium]